MILLTVTRTEAVVEFTSPPRHLYVLILSVYFSYERWLQKYFSIGCNLKIFCVKITKRRVFKGELTKIYKTVFCVIAICMYVCVYIYIYIYIHTHTGFKTFFYVVRHLDSIASYLPTGLHLGFFRSWPSLYLPSSFSSVFLVLSFVSASTSMLFWVIFLLPFSEHGRKLVLFNFFYNCFLYSSLLSYSYFSNSFFS